MGTQSSESAPSDVDLIARTLDGDRDAFEALVRRHYRAAFAVALAYTVNRADAEDVCHDAFVRAADKLETCKRRDRFAYWLCAIVRNLARNAARRSLAFRATVLPSDLPTAEPGPSREAERRDLGERLQRALTELPPAQREVVLLHDLDGWTHEAIAEALGTSIGMSRQHLFHARRRLRDTLGRGITKEYLYE